MNIKKWLSFLLVFCLCLNLLPLSVFANTDFYDENVNTELVNGNMGENDLSNIENTLILSTTSSSVIAKVNDTECESFGEAIDKVNELHGGKIILLQDIVIDTIYTISYDTEIVGDVTIYRSTENGGYKGTLFKVEKDVTLTLDGITYNGGSDWELDEDTYYNYLETGYKPNVDEKKALVSFTENSVIATAPVFNVEGSLIANNCVFEYNFSNTSNQGLVVLAKNKGEVFELNNSIVQNCGSFGNSVVCYVGSGKFSINEGSKIQNCHFGLNGGVSRCDNSIIEMNEGQILNNTACDANGFIFMVYGDGSTLIMNGGKIIDNSGCKGPANGFNSALYMHSNSKFILNNGEVSRNIGYESGGVYIRANSVLTKIMGDNVRIFDNTAVKPTSIYEDIYAAEVQRIQIYAGKYTQDITEWLAPNHGVIYEEIDGKEIYTVTTDIAELNGVIYSSVQEAVDMAESGEIVKLLCNSMLPGTVIIREDDDIIIDMNGKKLYSNILIHTDNDVVTTEDIETSIKVDGKLEIKNGAIISHKSNGKCFEVNGIAELDSVSCKGLGTTILNNSIGQVTITGSGLFEINENPTDSTPLVFENIFSGDGLYSVKGCTYKGFNPASPIDYVAVDHISELTDTVDEIEYYTVRALDYIAKTDGSQFEDLQEAIDISESGEVYLLRNVRVEDLIVSEDTILNLGSNVLSLNSSISTVNEIDFSIVNGELKSLDEKPILNSNSVAKITLDNIKMIADVNAIELKNGSLELKNKVDIKSKESAIYLGGSAENVNLLLGDTMQGELIGDIKIENCIPMVNIKGEVRLNGNLIVEDVEKENIEIENGYYSSDVSEYVVFKRIQGDNADDTYIYKVGPSVIISYNKNGSESEDISSVDIVKGSSYTLPDNGFTAPNGYQFSNWDIDGTAYNPGDNIVVEEDIEIKAIWSKIPSRPSRPITITYTPIIIESENGEVLVQPYRAEQNEKVTVEVTPIEGQKIIDIKITDKNGKELEVVEKDNKYIYKQPNSRVTIEVIYKEIQENIVCDGVAHTCPSLQFKDLDTSKWYHLNTDYVIENGLIKGYPNKLFGPEDAITRGQLVTILWRLEGCPIKDYLVTFEDVDTNAYYMDAICWGQSTKVIKGYSDIEFKPNKPITREEMVTIMWRYAMFKGYDVSISEDTNILSYNDVFDLSEYAISAMQWSCGVGLIKGDDKGYLLPLSETTRAQASAILQRYIENIYK